MIENIVAGTPSRAAVRIWSGGIPPYMWMACRKAAAVITAASRSPITYLVRRRSCSNFSAIPDRPGSRLAADCSACQGFDERGSLQSSANAIAQLEQDATILVPRNPNFRTTISNGAWQCRQTSSRISLLVNCGDPSMSKFARIILVSGFGGRIVGALKRNISASFRPARAHVPPHFSHD
jgi:hypothetical protein